VLKIVVAEAPALFYGFFFQRGRAVGVPMLAASGRPLPSHAPCVGLSCMTRSILMKTGSPSGFVTPWIETVTFLWFGGQTLSMLARAPLQVASGKMVVPLLLWTASG
jgi:hypothetical protein